MRLALLSSILLFLPACAAPEQSVKPGINNDFLDPDLDVDSMVQRFEVESREIAAQRTRIANAVGIREGMAVADIGAGTGLFMEPFAEMVGDSGTLYAVDIAPPFVEHLQNRAQSLGLSQVEAVLCTERSVELAANSVDVAFICDVYHHFEKPGSTMRSIHRALRPGGVVVVIDFSRIEGVSREWVLDHVRAGEEETTREIVADGFEVVRDVSQAPYVPPAPYLEENYMVRFRKKG